ncbi:MAG: putative Serine/threonine-protein kinase Nek3, partial [Streblomastix strix]
MSYPSLQYNDLKLVAKLGIGSQNKTYKVLLKLTIEEFVLKKEQYFSDEDKERVNRDIEQMKKLASRFTVRLITAFEHDEDMCIITQFYSKGDLRKFIGEIQELSEEERVMKVWAIVAQVIRSVDYLHSNNVIHRNIKPENIFLMEDGSVRLGDFKCSNSLVGDQESIVGTKVYFAPESWIKKITDFSSDIFPIGIIAYELLTGHNPFEAETEHGTVEKIKKGQYSQIPSFVPREMNEMIVSMLNSDSSKRPTTKQLLKIGMINMYLTMQEEKEKIQFDNSQEAEIAKRKTVEAQQEILRLKAQLASQQQQQQQYPAQTQQYTTAPQQYSVAPIQYPAQQQQFNQVQQPISYPPIASVETVFQVGPIPHNPINSSVFEDIRFNGETFTHTDKNKNNSTILFDPPITNGFAKIEVLNIRGLFQVGIVDDSVRCERNQLPLIQGWEKMAYYAN